MVSTALGLAAASWAVLMALSPILQIREIIRRRSSEGISIGYFAVLLVGLDCGFPTASRATICRSSFRTALRSWSWPAQSPSLSTNGKPSLRSFR
jgi:hypothetical protein